MEMLLRLLLGVLADLLLAFIRNLRATKVDDPSFLGIVQEIVRGLAIDHPDWPGDQKRDYARDAIRNYAETMGKNLKDSLINALIEVAVQRMKSEIKL